MQRKTKQRNAIREVFALYHRPLRPEEVHAFARESVPGLGLATVYRTLKKMLEHNELVEVRVPDVGTTLYEVADKEHHHHFYCRACERILDFEGCALRTGSLQAPDGFRVEHHEVFLYGLCPDCAALEPPSIDPDNT